MSARDALIDSIPEPQREPTRSALACALGQSAVSAWRPVVGGASGALTYHIEAGREQRFLRIETRRDFTRNPHQYVCMRAAADAGIAPPLLYLDADAGIAIMDWIAPRPLAEYPGGAMALAEALGHLVRRLQETPVFPELRDYPVLLGRLLDFLRTSGRFAPGLLDPHAEAFARIRDGYPWQRSPAVSSHNDPNPRNILFDGARLWLVDWETSYRNDASVDVAIMVDNLAPTPDLETHLLAAWLGRPPDDAARARLTLMRALTRLYYAGLLLGLSPASSEPHADLDALTPAEFGAALARGTFAAGSAEAMVALGKMVLAGFLDATRAPGFDAALARAG